MRLREMNAPRTEIVPDIRWRRRNGRYNDNPDRETSSRLFATVILRRGSQIMWARCRAPYHIQAPTTAQRNGQGLRLTRIGKAWERLFSTLIDFHSSFLYLTDGLKENARLKEWSRCSRAISCLRESNIENLKWSDCRGLSVRQTTI